MYEIDVHNTTDRYSEYVQPHLREERVGTATSKQLFPVSQLLGRRRGRGRGKRVNWWSV